MDSERYVRKSLPKREHEIATRLKGARIDLGQTQQSFAQQVGITRQALASYEEARAPLRYELALKICRQFIISEKWLATGKGEPRQMLDLGAEPLPSSINVGTRFSEVYDKFLFQLYDRIEKVNGPGVRIVARDGETHDYIANLLTYCMSLWDGHLPQDALRVLYALLLKTGAGFADFYFRFNRMPKSDAELTKYLRNKNPGIHFGLTIADEK